MGNSYLKYLLLFYFLLTATIKISAQFNLSRTDLIETTANREFNKIILEKYLSSTDSNDVIAALLSLSHSEDTSAVQDIVKLDFIKYNKWILFSLGQIGYSFSAKQFLWNKLNDLSCNCSQDVLNAFGKIGDEKDLTRLLELYKVNPELYGIEEAVLQFRNRNITNESSNEILVKEFTRANTSIERKKKILFTLARLGSHSSIIKELNNILHFNSDSEMLQLALMNLRVQKYFPDDDNLVKELFDKSDEVRIELVKSLPYSTSENTVLRIFRSILADKNINENILVETLKSLRLRKWELLLLNENKISDLLKRIIKFRQKNFIITEAIKTYSYLFGVDSLKNDSSLVNHLSAVNQFQLLIEDKNNLNISTLLSLYKNIQLSKEKLKALETLVSLTKDFSDNEDLSSFLLNEIQSGDNAIISTIADGLDSVFISRNNLKLKDIVLAKAKEFKNNSDFIETEISLVNLANKISQDFQNEVVEELSDTKLYSLRKFLKKFDDRIVIGNHKIENLKEMIDAAFRYSKAIIKTLKGNIVIKFRPEIAPVTVGNFILLSKAKFYNGISFHRVVPGFVIQAGDPKGTGWGGPGYEIISEFSPEEFHTGMVGMASAGKDTEGSQFFIMQGYYPHLNSRYTLFAEVMSGTDVVMKISEDDKIISIELIE